MIWKHVLGILKRVRFSAFRIFHLRSFKDPENLKTKNKTQKISHWNKSKWRLKQGRKKKTTGVGSLATWFSKTSSEDEDVAGEGPEGARRQPFPRVSQNLLPRSEALSLPGPPMGRSRLPRGTALPTARPEEGTGARTRCSRRPGRQERTPGSQLQSPPPRTHPCGPARSLRGRPQISP